MKSGNFNFLEPFGPVQACNGTVLPFFFLMKRVFFMLNAAFAIAILDLI